VAYRDDHPGGAPQPGLADDAWQYCVPIRLPDTVCVQERLPPGAAAVLINRTHPYRDLVMPITAAEKRLFDVVDGTRTLADIAAGASSEMVHSFFERLGWWDQVVFDRSNAPASR